MIKVVNWMIEKVFGGIGWVLIKTGLVRGYGDWYNDC